MAELDLQLNIPCRAASGQQGRKKAWENVEINVWRGWRYYRLSSTLNHNGW